jgi:hypothetical protein
LTGKSLSGIGQALAGFLDEKSIRIIGFNPSDLELALAGQEPDYVRICYNIFRTD